MNLPKGNTVLSQDPRPITGIFFDDEEGSHFQVGEFEVTSIVAYDENGLGGCIPWLAVYEGERIVRRVPAHMVEVAY